MALIPMSALIRWRTRRFIGPVITELLGIYGLDLPPQVQLGEDVLFWHRGLGTVITPWTSIGDRVHIFQGVTIGGSDPTLRHRPGFFEGVRIEDDAILCAGAKVLAGSTLLTVGRGTIVGANSVLLESTGEYEIWGGIPARCLGSREHGQRNTPIRMGDAPVRERSLTRIARSARHVRALRRE
ncbi:MAG: serine O-acetyltransferase [Pseudonocardiales bacterium]|nr:serine O-acetyltransferase [Pseudonocardiales bacterium]